jgi:hypothetical protein
MGLLGVTTLDLDEAANLIAVGVEPNADRARILEYLAARQVPEAAVDINYQTLGNIKRRVWCYDRANLGADGGDSGSPVFRIFDPGAGIVYFYGLVSFRGTDQAGSTGFGSVRQLRGELGAFQVF